MHDEYDRMNTVEHVRATASFIHFSCIIYDTTR